MEISTRYNRAAQTQLSAALKQRRSGYEPSDAETDWPESPWHGPTKMNGDVGSEGIDMLLEQKRNTSPLKLNHRHTAKFEHEVSSSTKVSTASSVRRRHSRSPYKPQRDDGNARLPIPPGYEFRRNVSPLSPRLGSEIRKNISPFSRSNRGRHASPYKPTRENLDLGDDDAIKMTEKSNYSHRSMSAPRSKSRDKNHQARYDHREQKRRDTRTPSPLPKNIPWDEREATHKHAPSVGEVNELIANTKISRGPIDDAPIMESSDSISQGDIFFSHNYTALAMQKNGFPNSDFESRVAPNLKLFTEKVANSNSNHTRGDSISTVITRTTTTFSNSLSRQSSNLSNASGRTTESTKKFTTNRQKNQTEAAWFSCIKKGSCRASKKSPEKNRAFDEASFIEKAFVVENLRQFWADKYQPASLNGFTCHKQEAQLLKQLLSNEMCPHILLKGPPGSGKKALAMALLREIYGDSVSNISHDQKYFQIVLSNFPNPIPDPLLLYRQEARPVQVVVPVISSPHHVELNVFLEPNAKYALMALVKQISSDNAVSPEISTVNFKPDYTVMVLYDVDKADDHIQHMIKWVMDCYTDICKLVILCEDDIDILEQIKSRCKVLEVDAPVTPEIMEVLIQIARKENFDLSMNFAAKIATKSKQNLRRAIMALEASKAHKLFFIRGKFQKLLVDFVHPKLILQKLVEQFLKGVEASLKRELYYWHGYYDKRLPLGMSALLKLEEFMAKFISIYRKSCSNRQYS
ncbi:hypothetical protein LguiA_005817 [Lonicera macranthoides]